MKGIILENRTKIIYQAEKENELIQEFKDDFQIDNAAKGMKIKDRGEFNNQFSSHIFKLLSSYHIPTHFVKIHSENSMVVKKIEMIPIVVCMRNIAAGTLVKNFGLKKGKELECPLIEYYMKNEKDEDQIINEAHIISFGYATGEELKEMHRITSKVNVIIKDYLRRRFFKLVDFRLEFGRYKEDHIMVGSEINLDTCHILNVETNEIIFEEKHYEDKKEMVNIYNDLSARLL
ncbi:phosphoribosylaminoimidazolesuccinocarboxamide synthase [candidate division KSB1 bacterium]|nr:phosphoribosylaminoimidazolesuccinocarboxamide synthase [candidate division KSB1 bacterium]